MNARQVKYAPLAKAAKAPLANERGAALILVMFILLFLTILGTTVLTSSTTEIRLAGNNMNLQQAFFTAQGALEYAPVDSVISFAMNDVGDRWTGTITFNNDSVAVVTNATAAAGTPKTANVTVQYVATSTPPRGSGASADAFVANYYDVDVVGMGPNNSEVEIVSEVYKLQAKVN